MSSTTGSTMRNKKYTVLRSVTLWQRTEVLAQTREGAARQARKPDVLWETTMQEPGWEPVVLRKLKNNAFALE